MGSVGRPHTSFPQVLSPGHEDCNTGLGNPTGRTGPETSQRARPLTRPVPDTQLANAGSSACAARGQGWAQDDTQPVGSACKDGRPLKPWEAPGNAHSHTQPRKFGRKH